MSHAKKEYCVKKTSKLNPFVNVDYGVEFNDLVNQKVLYFS